MTPPTGRRDADIRASYLVFPAPTQPFWTWLTGKALSHEAPVVRVSPWGYLAVSLFTLCAGFAASAYGVVLRSGWSAILIVVGCLLTVSAARKLVSVVVHQCIHNKFDPNRGLSAFVAEAITLVLFTQNARAYQRDHTHLHHRPGVFTTELDPSAIFLQQCGFERGMPVRSAWLNLARTTVSPLFHANFLWRRIVGNFADAGPARRACAFVLWAGVAAAFAFAGRWRLPAAEIFAVAYVVPVVVLYQISILMEFISEHAWLVASSGDDFSATLPVHHSWGRFCGARVPRRGGPVLAQAAAWVRWSALMLFYHLPLRVAILPGDLPHHDFHHRYPGNASWTHTAFARQRDVDRAPGKYAEFWGLHRAIGHVFAQLAVMPHAPARPSRQLEPHHDFEMV